MRRTLDTFKFYFSVLIFLCCLPAFYAQTKVQGRVFDANGKKPLPFASVLIRGQSIGTTTDIDGNFALPVQNLPVTLEIRYLGYYTHFWDVHEFPDKPILIQLRPMPVQLAEIQFSPGLSPAERLVRRIWAKRDTLDPARLSSYTYEAYQKIILTSALDTIVPTVSTTITGEQDSSMFEAKALLDRQYLFLNESVIRKKYKKPRSYDEVIASRTSGTTIPIISALTTQLQSLSFFEENFSVLGINYVNPLAPPGWKKYFYSIEDTVISGTDSILVIQFKPYAGQEEEGLEGQFRINISQIALESALAKPVSENDSRISILQLYEPVDSIYWFPRQWHADLVFKQASVNGIPLKLECRTYVRNVELFSEIRNREFGALAVEVAPDAVKNAAERLQEYRISPLDSKDSLTYHVIDSLGQAINLDRKLKGLDALMTGKLRIGIFDFDLNRLMAANQYEGFRLGLGIETNENLLSWVKVGGYIGYGFKDAAFKYGGFGEFLIHRKSDFRIRAFYRSDIFEAGNTEPEIEVPFSMDAAYRTFAVSRFDSVQQYGMRLALRPVPNLNLWLTGSRSEVNPTYTYAYADSNTNAAFRFTEMEMSIRWGIGEKYIAFGYTRMRLPTQKPVLYLGITQALPVNGENWQFTRITARLEENFKWGKAGKTSMMLIGGLLLGDAPYGKLFNSRGSYTDVSVVSGFAFETARANEFMQDRFVAVYLRHQFPPFFKVRKLIRPSLSMHYNLGWGHISNPERHVYIPANAMQKGLFEGGLALNDILVLNGTGFGIGVFHRHGAYSTGQIADDLYFKLAISFSFLGD